MDFTVKFEPATTSSGAMARKFCLEQGGHFGITEATLDNCINPIAKHFQAAIDSRDAADAKAAVSQAAASTRQLTPVLAKFKIGELDYQINFYPTLVTPEQVAVEFCSKKGGEFGITADTFASCTTPVAAHVNGVLQEYNRAQLAAVTAATPPPQEYKTVNVSYERQ
jgi:putative hemolysin